MPCQPEGQHGRRWPPPAVPRRSSALTLRRDGRPRRRLLLHPAARAGWGVGTGVRASGSPPDLGEGGMCRSRRRRDADALRQLFLARLQRLLALRAGADPDPQRLLLIERAIGSTLVDCLRLGALVEALALLREVGTAPRQRPAPERGESPSPLPPLPGGVDFLQEAGGSAPAALPRANRSAHADDP